MRTRINGKGGRLFPVADPTGVSLRPAMSGAKPSELVSALLEPPEVRAELVAYLKKAIAGNRYHVPEELVAQSILECWTPCLRN